MREELQKQCGEAGIPFRIPVRDVATRWNSLTRVIDRALELRPALDKLVGLKQFNKTSGAKVNHFRLEPVHWLLLTQLKLLLDQFVEATEHISQYNHPLLHEVIPLIDILTESLDNTIDDFTLLPTVCAVALRGKLVMKKYYSYTDDSVMYRLAMLLHPRYKSVYFEKKNWCLLWVDTALELLRDQWNLHYKPKLVVAHKVCVSYWIAHQSSNSIVRNSKPDMKASLRSWMNRMCPVIVMR